jgi:hypothetical protein
MECLYLSERNLRTLLNKLERYKCGENTECTIIKYRNIGDPVYQSMDAIAIEAVLDEEYYINRNPGKVLDIDLGNNVMKPLDKN